MMVQLCVSVIISRSSGWARKTEVELNWYERLGHKKENIYISCGQVVDGCEMYR